MLYARFLAPNDQDMAERCLHRALALIEQGDFSDEERHFQTVFLCNGLALVRLRQGRVSEALELCRAGVQRLNAHLSPERHQLHRSVLLFNIAQVHAQIGPYEDAIEYFGEAIKVDPNYSEYYNDRGALWRALLQDRSAPARRARLPAGNRAQPALPRGVDQPGAVPSRDGADGRRGARVLARARSRSQPRAGSCRPRRGLLSARPRRARAGRL